MKIRTYTQLEAILRTAFDVEGNSIKNVAEIAEINKNIMIVKPINKRFEVSSLQTYRFEPTNEPINLFCICSLL